MQTPESESSGQGKLRPWQFSLRSLMILTGGLGLLLGICQLRAAESVTQVCSLVVFFFQNYLLIILTVRNCRPDRWMLVLGLGASLLPAVFLVLRGEHWQAPYHSWFVVLMLASLLAWPSLGVVGWVVRSATSSQDWQVLRRLSVVHLLVETACLGCVCVAALLHGKGLTWDGFAGERYGGHGGGVLLLALLANSIPLILWLSLFSPWRNIPQRAWPDSLFRGSLIASLGIAIPSCLAMLYLSLNHDRLDEYYSSRGEYTLFWYEITSALVFGLPQMVSSALFASGTTCQLFRRHQDRLLIALGCLYFIPFWLFLLLGTARIP